MRSTPSPPVYKAATHSLEVERRHKEVKLWEASKVVHIATASRNAIATRFAKERATRSHEILQVGAYAAKVNPRCDELRLATGDPRTVGYPLTSDTRLAHTTD